MRTSITLDEKVYEIVSLYAHGRGITLGAAIGELVRKASSQPEPAPPSRLKRLSNGLLVMPAGGRAITSEMVKSHLEDPIEKYAIPARRQRAGRPAGRGTHPPREGNAVV